MAIAESEPTCAIVVTGWEIDDLGALGILLYHLHSAGSVVDAVRVLVDKNKTHRGSRINHVRILFVGAKRWCWKPKARAESLAG